MEGDIFEGFMFNWAPLKKLIHKEMYKGMLTEVFHHLGCPNKVVSKVATTVVVAEKMGIRMEWIDRIIGEIGAGRDHFELLCEARLLRTNWKSFKSKWIEQDGGLRSSTPRCLVETFLWIQLIVITSKL